MKLIFVSGPYRSPEGSNGVFNNVVHARQVARKLWVKGWAVFCPHTNSMYMEGPDFDNEKFYAGDLKILEFCDAIMMLNGWDKSEGAQGEYMYSYEHDQEIYFEKDGIPDTEGKYE